MQVDCDMHFARMAEEIWWVEEFHRHLDGILSMRTVYSKVRQFDFPLLQKDLYRVYFYRDWGGWVKDLAFERHMEHLLERFDGTRAELVFVRWHSVELFAVPLHHGILLYHLVPSWWT